MLKFVFIENEWLRRNNRFVDDEKCAGNIKQKLPDDYSINVCGFIEVAQSVQLILQFGIQENLYAAVE